jgi:hypothetical protein
MVTNEEEIFVYVTAFIGAYMIIRGLSFFLGGYPNEVQTFAQLNDGNFEISGYLYLYFLLFIALNVAGSRVQEKQYDSDWRKRDNYFRYRNN